MSLTPNIRLTTEDRQGVVEILNNLLADEFVLYTKTRNYHWNVTGPHFHDLHALFESQYEELAETVDDVAERVRSLGGRASGSMTEFLKQTRLQEDTGENVNASAMVASLLGGHEAVIQSLRADRESCGEKHHDAGTDDFLTGLMEKHEKTAWMLRAVLERG